MASKYYSLQRILDIHAQYYVIFGERSNGKTYAALKLTVEDYVQNGRQSVIVRRNDLDFLRGRGRVMFDGLVANGEISRLTGGEWTGVTFIGREWYFCRTDSKIGLVHDETWFCRAMSLSTAMHDKSTSYPGVYNVIFDEFIAKTYMDDEFGIFMNVLSTVIRDRTGIRVFMLGNTINRFCPYFKEMGLKHVMTQKPGTIDVYEYGDSGMRVAVERCNTAKERGGKESDVYFAFDNPTLRMIKTGEWDIQAYPRKPVDFERRDVLFTYFIIFSGQTFQCEVIQKDGCAFTYVHRKTTPIQNEKRDVVYQLEVDPRPNIRNHFTRPATEFDRKLYSFFLRGKVFYQDNDVGDTIRNFLASDSQT